MTYRTIMGIDPDMSGGIVTISFPDKKVQTIRRMPTRDLERGQQLDSEAVWKIFMGHLPAPDYIALESAVVMQQSKGKMMGGVHRTHQTFGGLRALSEALVGARRVRVVQPAVWKRDMGLAADKDLSLAKAHDLHPDLAKLWSVKKNAGIAEALILCHWLWPRVT